MELKFEERAKIRKPVAEVFRAVYDPETLSRYFTNGGASGPLLEGASVTWRFTEFPGEFPVHVTKVLTNQRIEFDWALPGGSKNHVAFVFEALDERSTLVRIGATGWPSTQAGADESYSHCSGWMQMLCSLKVYLEDGRNLREFFF